MPDVPDTLTPGDGQDALARYKRAWEKRDPELMLSMLVATDAEYRPDPFEPPLKGSNDIRRYWNRIAAERAHVEFDAERVWVVGRTVLSNWHAAFTRRESGERVRVRGFTSMELDESGLIWRLREWPVSRSIGTDSGFEPDLPVADRGKDDDG